mmetsp:Transcript_17882/g.21878  ORF Transcript_17882/g.21878 Transcript_17882/m.21878 type:complete len:180 (-) Transcript_17882:110-649(-)
MSNTQKKRRSISPLSTSLISNKKATNSAMKCSKCQKLGRRSCSQKACIKCCTDQNCEGHRDVREKEAILEGRHPINKMADAKRALTIKPGAFHETAFQYLGETVLIWSLADYMSNPKWRDEAIRKSRRNLESIRNEGIEGSLYCHDKGVNLKDQRKESRRKRFRRVMNELYEQSLIQKP